MQNLKGKTVVITGASSGNGKAAALKFAGRGADVVLAARRENLLQALAGECEALGVRALAVRADVTVMEDMRRLYLEALNLNGHIDVWVNNAGVLALGPFLNTPPELSQQVIKTNLLGCIHGAHAIIPHFIERKKGILITMNSLSAFVPTPYVAAYSASKVGLKGFTEALRYEMSAYAEIHVCDIYATFLDTTGLDHAANLTGHKVAPPPPVYDPCQVAETMVKLVQHPKDSVTLGLNAHLGKAAHAVAPKLLGKMMARVTELYLKIAPPEEITTGNLLRPLKHGKDIHGGWRMLNYFKRLKH